MLEAILNVLKDPNTWITIVSIIIALVQAIQKKELNRTLKQVKKVQKLDTWTNINMVLKTYDSLTDMRDILKDGYKQEDHPLLLSKVSSARRGTVDEWRYLLKQAVLEEDEFDEETVQLWLEQHKLDNEWKADQARQLITKETMKNEKKDNIFRRVRDRRKQERSLWEKK